MPTTLGCAEHHLKLASILSEAKRRHKSLAVCWLDLANAYGSVHHSFIQFPLRYYHVPPQFCRTLKALYTGLSAKIIATDWSTPVIPLKIGVYQGDPLLVVIFNMEMNTLIDTLQTHLDLGYSISWSKLQVKGGTTESGASECVGESKTKRGDITTVQTTFDPVCR